MDKANVVFVFGDQWRAQATGYAGDPNVKTPHLDRLAEQSLNLTNAVSGCPVCTPYRGSLLTGEFPLTNGLFTNDVPLDTDAVGLGTAFQRAGYRTAYIGKWHVNDHGRKAYIPPERRRGFEFWRTLECTHDYWNSIYYADDEREQRVWDGYDAFAQTREACRYIRDHDSDDPFLLMLSWGPPHNPYKTAPDEYKSLYDPDGLTLRPNVPPEREAEARRDLVGYYGHISALDTCVGQLTDTLEECGLSENTIFVFTSDHGDMVGCHHWKTNKQCPYDESIMVPFLIRWPDGLPEGAQTVRTPIDAPDIMPTLLSLCDAEIPSSVEGRDLTPALRGKDDPSEDDGIIIANYAPFADWNKVERGGREYRGLRTTRYTYVTDRDGPWMLFDNREDPYQMENLIDLPDARPVREHLQKILDRKMEERGDEFLSAREYLEMWNYDYDETGTVPYTS